MIIKFTILGNKCKVLEEPSMIWYLKWYYTQESFTQKFLHSCSIP